MTLISIGQFYDRPRREWIEYEYATTLAGEVSDSSLKERNLLVRRGMVVDGIFQNTRIGRAIVKNSYTTEKGGKTYASD
jgi:hypothetical protein